MEIMERVREAREELSRIESEMSDIVRSAIYSGNLEIDPDICITPQFHYERLMVSIHPLNANEERKEAETFINDIGFFITCDIEIKKLIRIAQLIRGADQILNGNS